MPNIPNLWKTDLFPFVGQMFKVNLDNSIKSNPLINLFDEIVTESAHYDLRGSGDFPELPDYDGSLNEINPRRNFNTTISTLEKQGTYHIHYKQWKNDRTREVERAGSQLADAIYTTINNRVLRKFASAFDSTVLGGDGKPWAATDHPNGSVGSTAGSRLFTADANGGTYQNLFTETLSYAALKEILGYARRLETPSGNPYEANFDTLLVSPELTEYAIELQQSKLNPDNAENTKNVVKIKNIITCGAGNVNRGLGFGANQWALVDSKRFNKTSAIVYNTKPKVDRMININPYIKSFSAYVDFEVGYGDARAIMFSNPS